MGRFNVDLEVPALVVKWKFAKTLMRTGLFTF